MEIAKEGRYADIPEQAFPIYVHRNRHGAGSGGKTGLTDTSSRPDAPEQTERRRGRTLETTMRVNVALSKETL